MGQKSNLYDHVERNLDWFLEAYVGLDATEKKVVQQYVQEHPDHPEYDKWVGRLVEAKSMEHLLADAAALADAGRDHETLPYSFLASRLQNGPDTESLTRELLRIQRRRQGKSESQEDDQIKQRLALANGIIAKQTALEHFESLTGHVVREEPAEYGLVRSVRDRIRSGPGYRKVTSRDRAPEPTVEKRVARVFGKVAQPIVVALFVVLILQITSYTNDTPVERRTHLTAADVEWAANGLSNRGYLSGSEISVYEDYVHISNYVSAARKSVFGLFPSYRPELLYHARFLMDQTHRKLGENKSPPGAALVLYAKINFWLGDIDGMIPALNEAAKSDGPSAVEARNIMAAMREASLMD